MTDAYVRGELSDSDLEAFKANYLISETRREKVAYSESLWRIASEQQTKVFASGRSSSVPFWKMLTSWKFITGVAVILLGYGLVYFALYSGRLTVELASGPDNSGGPLLSVSKSEKPEPVNNVVSATTEENVNVTIINANTAKPNPKPPVSTATLPAAIATFTLTPGALRNEGEQAIKLASKTATVDLRLAPPKNAAKYPSYSVTLKSADGETVLSDPRVRYLRLRVPASKLENRTYIVFVEGMTATAISEPVAEYTFRVRR